MIACVGTAIYIVNFHEPDTGANEPPPFATNGFFETQAQTKPSETNNEQDIETSPVETQPTDPSELPRSQQKIYNFLLVGQDRVALNTDVIILINLNTTTNKINVLQIPRDTYIELSTYYGKINGVFAHYYLNNGRDTKTGLRMFADTLEQNLCIKIHNVVHINLNGVRKIVDALGGVDINISTPFSYIDETTQKWATLPVGVNHIDGYLAEQFIRHRSSYANADIGRMDAQKIFMSALIQKVQSSFNISTIATMADVVFDNVITDISVADGIYYAKSLLGINMSEINFMSMTGKSSGSNPNGTGVSYYVMIRKNMQEVIDKYFNIYDFSITDAIFDANRAFTSIKRYPHINNIYTNQNFETKDPHSADDINDSSLNIPKKQK